MVTFFSFVGFHCVLSSFFYYMLPTIFTAFLYGFLYHFLSFPAFHAFSIYFSKSSTRLLQFPIVFAPFPLVVIAFSCTFTVFFQHVYCIVIVCSCSRSGFLHVPTDFAPFILVVITFSCQVVITFSFTVSFQHFPWILHDFLWLLSCFPAVSISSSWVFSLFMHF